MADARVKDTDSVELAIANGAEFITCNNPDVILDLLRLLCSVSADVENDSKMQMIFDGNSG